MNVYGSVGLASLHSDVETKSSNILNYLFYSQKMRQIHPVMVRLKI